MVFNNSQSSVLHSLIFVCSFFYIISFLRRGTALNFNLGQISPQNLNVDITVENDAYISPHGIEVTSDEYNVNRKQKAGRAMYIQPFHLWDNTSGNLADFNTHFSFVIDSEQNLLYGDGMTFFLIAPGDSNITKGVAMGLPVDQFPHNPTTPFVAIEFDTYNNHDVDPQNITTHVGIDINSLNSNTTAVWESGVYSGFENEAWVSYNSSSRKLSVKFTNFRNLTIVVKDVHLIVDLREYLPEWVRIGFSASTGTLFQRNNVRSWQFYSSLQIDNKTGSVHDATGLVPEKAKGVRIATGMRVGSTISLFFLLLGW